MARAVRFLLKVPAVRRVMLRLANAEAALAKQQGRLGDLSGLLQRLSADEASNRALLAQVSEYMPPARLKQLNSTLEAQQAETETLSAALEDQQTELAALSAVLRGQQAETETLNAALQGQQAGLGTLSATTQGQQAELGTLNATVQRQQAELAGVNELVQRLSSDAAHHRALLAEVSQHLPPAQRANLEATLHGQQLQLGALNSTMHANQIQLGALNDIVQRLSAENASQRALLAEVSAQVPPARLADLETTIAEQQARLAALNDLHHQLGTIQQEKQALAEKITNLEQENRRLKVGHGATFEELAASGKLSLDAPYRFDDLLSFRQMSRQSAPSVPPLVHVHVPKAAGTTLNNILMKNYRYRLDSYGSDFFPRYYPDEFVSLVQPPLSDDTRRPVFFTGHIDLANDIFRYMPVRYVAITVLRDPVERIVSHYRFHSTLSGSPLAAEIGKGDIVQYFQRFRSQIPLQYEMFAPRGTEEDGGRVAAALRNLEDRVSFFGLQDHFEELVVLLAELLGLPNVSYKPLNKTLENSAAATRKQTEELHTLLADDVAFYDGATKLYRQRADALPFDLAGRVSALKQERNGRKPRNNRPHPWRDLYS